MSSAVSAELPLKTKLQSVLWTEVPEEYYTLAFQCLVVTCAGLLYTQRTYFRTDTSPEFQLFQFGYLSVYLLAIAADSIQLPYLYTYYTDYDYSRTQISFLLAVYYFSASVASLSLGVAADRWGRRRVCSLFWLAALVACLSAHSDSFKVHLLARVATGASMGILTSVMEASLIGETAKLGFRGEWVAGTLCAAAFGAPLISLLTGVVANSFVSTMADPAVPFDLALVPALATSLLLTLTWGETKGLAGVGVGTEGGSSTTALLRAVRAAYSAVARERRLVVLAILEVCCGCPMALFPLLWPPAIIDDGRGAPLGLLSACLALSAMCGALLAALSITGGLGGVALKLHPHNLSAVLFVAAGSLLIPLQCQAVGVQVAVFCIFQICAGVMGPALARLRSVYIEESQRGAVTGLLRAPPLLLVGLLALSGESTLPMALSVMLLLVGAVTPLALAFLPGDVLQGGGSLYA